MVSSRTRKEQNDVKDKGRTFKRSLEELSLLCERFVPGWAAEGIQKTPTQKCSVLIRKRYCCWFMLLHACSLADQPAIHT